MAKTSTRLIWIYWTINDLHISHEAWPGLADCERIRTHGIQNAKQTIARFIGIQFKFITIPVLYPGNKHTESIFHHAPIPSQAAATRLDSASLLFPLILVLQLPCAITMLLRIKVKQVYSGSTSLSYPLDPGGEKRWSAEICWNRSRFNRCNSSQS